eukprot:1136798-Pelagomonas_calceolata.AAC.3
MWRKHQLKTRDEVQVLKTWQVQCSSWRVLSFWHVSDTRDTHSMIECALKEPTWHLVAGPPYPPLQPQIAG